MMMDRVKPFVKSARRFAAGSGIAVLAVTVGVGCSQFGGTMAEPFNGKDLTGWKPLVEDNAWLAAGEVSLNPENEKLFEINPGEGILVNGPTGRTSNLLSDVQHGDCEAHVEFVVPKGSNSGVYFMGKYEIQILDSFGKAKPEFSDCGGIYARWIDEKNVEGHPPAVNAAKPAGEWQSFDVVFLAPRFDESGKKVENARFVKVVHNGQVVHEDVELKGSTRSKMPGPERARGPLMLQGDHGPVAFRNIRMKLLD
jgi:hypothetical protein